jgi:hypothetical protein
MPNKRINGMKDIYDMTIEELDAKLIVGRAVWRHSEPIRRLKLGNPPISEREPRATQRFQRWDAYEENDRPNLIDTET